jgi:hypothetical protein
VAPLEARHLRQMAGAKHNLCFQLDTRPTIRGTTNESKERTSREGDDRKRKTAADDLHAILPQGVRSAVRKGFVAFIRANGLTLGTACQRARPSLVVIAAGS